MKLVRYLAVIALLTTCACDSIDQAQKRNTVELHSNPDTTPNPKPTPDATSYPAAEYEESKR